MPTGRDEEKNSICWDCQRHWQAVASPDCERFFALLGGRARGEADSGSVLQCERHIRTFVKRRVEAWLTREHMSVQSCPPNKQARFKARFMPTEPSYPGRVEGCMVKRLWGPTQCRWQNGGCAQHGRFGSEPPVRAVSQEQRRLEQST